ncbi:MAG TPA: Nramp family divalent metal transporter [Solirubrobacteraceae bacterium]|jgi:NRAMP (natural resistance-associated macrophage protein)-like metal ion transporter|nr:Nramp family divalent metal transporter [Solirubrobacteraceae bacterium]
MAEDPVTLEDSLAPAPIPADAPARSAGAAPAAGGVPPVLDDAHIGDIRGALGTIRMHDSGERYGWRSRAMALLAIMGPGLIVMVGDNDAGGVSTYAQAGQNYGTTLLWVLLLLIPVLIVNQEMVIRLGAVTGVGHARLINERFGRFWGWFSVGDLFILNFLTIVTEFIGVSLALGYFGVSKYLAVPLAALALIAITSTGSFRSWERFMYVFVVANFLVIPLLVLAHPSVSQIAQDTFRPSIQGGVNSTSVLLIIAIVGTTVAPWQLFFQQSNIVDKRITPRWINYERADTVIGAFVVVIGAGALIAVSAFAFAGTPYAGHFNDAGTVATALGRQLGSLAGTFFAVILLNASLIGAAAVTLSTSYAFGDVFGASHSLHRGLRDAKFFYASFALIVTAAAGIVLIPGAPLGLITTSVQALAGVLLPSATVFLLLLCNDRQVLGPWVNARWLNVIASVIVAILIELSLILMISTMFPSVGITQLFLYLSLLTFACLAVGAIYVVRSAGIGGAQASAEEEVARERRHTWTMPPLALLERPVWSPGRKAAMLLLRGYLVVAVLLLVIKTVQLGH